METKRLFVATFVAQHIFQRHFDNIKTIFADTCSGKWSDIQNLHFTYKFLGNVPIDKISEIKDLLDDKLIEYDSILKFNGLGVLNSPQNPQTLYARVYSPDKKVLDNFLDIESRLVKYGFAKEKRKFLAHATLLRIKKFDEKFEETFELNKELYIGKQQKFRIDLVASTLTHDGPIYEIIS